MFAPLCCQFMFRLISCFTGVEIRYDMYSPMLQKIEVLKLEKRLDEELFYLRDAPAEYSTFPFDMDRIPHQPGTQVPVNTLKVDVTSSISVYPKNTCSYFLNTNIFVFWP